MLNVPIPNIFETLSINLGTAYVNDFNAFGRVYQVRAQADQAFRLDRDDILAAEGALGDRRAGAARHAGRDPRRHRPGAGPALQHVCLGAAAGQRRARRFDRRRARHDGRRSRQETLPAGTSFEWTELAYQERNTGNTAIYIFALSVLFVFLALAAQYESWVLPLAIMLIVPLGVLAALLGVSFPRAGQQHPRRRSASSC